MQQVLQITGFIAPLVCLLLVKEVQKKMAEFELIIPESEPDQHLDQTFETVSTITPKKEDKTKSIDFEFSPRSSKSSF